MSASALEEIMQRERKVRADLVDPGVTEINLPRGFYHEQIGLRPVMIDPIGRLWDVGGATMKMIFDPQQHKKENTNG